MKPLAVVGLLLLLVAAGFGAGTAYAHSELSAASRRADVAMATANSPACQAAAGLAPGKGVSAGGVDASDCRMASLAVGDMTHEMNALGSDRTIYALIAAAALVAGVALLVVGRRSRPVPA